MDVQRVIHYQERLMIEVDGDGELIITSYNTDADLQLQLIAINPDNVWMFVGKIIEALEEHEALVKAMAK